MVHEHPVADMSSCVYRITFTSSRSSSSSMGCGHTPLQRRRRRRNSTSNRMGYYSRSGIHLSSAYSSAAIMGTSNNAGRPSLPPSLLSPLQPPPSGGQEEQQALTPPLDQPSMALIIPVVNKFHRNTVWPLESHDEIKLLTCIPLTYTHRPVLHRLFHHHVRRHHSFWSSYPRGTPATSCSDSEGQTATSSKRVPPTTRNVDPISGSVTVMIYM